MSLPHHSWPWLWARSAREDNFGRRRSPGHRASGSRAAEASCLFQVWLGNGGWSHRTTDLQGPCRKAVTPSETPAPSDSPCHSSKTFETPFSPQAYLEKKDKKKKQKTSGPPANTHARGHTRRAHTHTCRPTSENTGHSLQHDFSLGLTLRAHPGLPHSHHGEAAPPKMTPPFPVRLPGPGLAPARQEPTDSLEAQKPPSNLLPAQPRQTSNPSERLPTPNCPSNFRLDVSKMTFLCSLWPVLYLIP